MRTRLRLVVTAMGGLLLVCGINGCQINYRYEISGVVRSAADGALLAGVTVRFPNDWIRESPFPVVTGPDGTFSARFSVSAGQFSGNQSPKWTLYLSKDGYQSDTVEVSPQSPDSPNRTTFVACPIKSIKPIERTEAQVPPKDE